MLILVAVTVTTVINSGLIGKTQSVGKKTQEKYEEEAQLGNIIEIDGKIYASMEDYVAEIERAPEIMKGDGTKENPYTIDNIEGLIQFAYSVTNGKTYKGEYVKLTRNLDFESADSYINAYRTDYEKYGYTGELITAISTGNGFSSIGSVELFSENGFSGTFEGNGKIISNLRIHLTDNSKQCVGLFATNYGTIKNIGINDCDVNINFEEKSDAYELIYASLCGYNYGTIEGCWASGKIIVTIENVGTKLCIGGVVGSSSKTDSAVKNCYNKVNIEVNRKETEKIGTYVGGVVCNSTVSLIANCYNVGNIGVNYPMGDR